MVEMGHELNDHVGPPWWAGFGGTVEAFQYLRGRGYEFDRKACEGAAREGHLNALKFLRGLDPPCPWSANTCTYAAEGGHLDVLKWLRAQNPPCPWSRSQCRGGGKQQHVIDWIDQQEDESDAEDWEYSDSDDVWRQW